MFHLDWTTVSLYLRLARLPQAILDRIADPRALSMTKARRLMAEIEQQGEGALRRVIEALDRYDSVVSARGAQPVAEDQVDAAIRAAEGRGLPRILKETGEGPNTERRVIIHRGRRVGTLTRN